MQYHVNFMDQIRVNLRVLIFFVFVLGGERGGGGGVGRVCHGSILLFLYYFTIFVHP